MVFAFIIYFYFYIFILFTFITRLQSNNAEGISCDLHLLPYDDSATFLPAEITKMNINPVVIIYITRANRYDKSSEKLLLVYYCKHWLYHSYNLHCNKDAVLNLNMLEVSLCFVIGTTNLVDVRFQIISLQIG